MSKVCGVDTDELQDLYATLDAPLDFDGVLGLLHAVASAPGAIASQVWLEAILPTSSPSPTPPAGKTPISDAGPSSAQPSNSGPSSRKPAIQAQLRAGLLQQFEEIRQALAEGAAFIPDPDEDEAWVSFASGYVAGAALDETWSSDSERWSLVGWFAYLAGARQHVAADMLAELDADPNASDIICDKAPQMIQAIYAEFHAASRGLPGAPPQRAPQAKEPGKAPPRSSPANSGSRKGNTRPGKSRRH